MGLTYKDICHDVRASYPLDFVTPNSHQINEGVHVKNSAHYRNEAVDACFYSLRNVKNPAAKAQVIINDLEKHNPGKYSYRNEYDPKNWVRDSSGRLITSGGHIHIQIKHSFAGAAGASVHSNRDARQAATEGDSNTEAGQLANMSLMQGLMMQWQTMQSLFMNTLGMGIDASPLMGIYSQFSNACSNLMQSLAGGLGRVSSAFGFSGIRHKADASESALRAKYEPQVCAIFRKMGITGLLSRVGRSIFAKESGWNPYAVGDHGLSTGWQQTYVGNHNADWYSQRQAFYGNNGKFDPEYMCKSWWREFSGKLAQAHGDVKRAIGLYNGKGPMADDYMNDVWNNILPQYS